MGNTAELVVAARDEMSSAFRRMAAAGGELTLAFGRVAAAAGPVGIAVAAMGTSIAIATGLAIKLSDEVEQLGRVAGGSGATIPQIQVLRQAFKNAGMSAEDADAAISFFATNVGKGNKHLKEMGIDTRNAFVGLMQMSDAYRLSTNESAKSALSMEVLGRGGRKMSGIVGELRGQVEIAARELGNFGGFLDDKVIKQMKLLDAQLDILKTRWGAVFLRLEADFGPMAIKIVGFALDIAESLRNIGLAAQFAFDLITGKGLHGALEHLKEASASFKLPELTSPKMPNMLEDPAEAAKIEAIADALHLTAAGARAIYEQLQKFQSIKLGRDLRKQLSEMFGVIAVEGTEVVGKKDPLEEFRRTLEEMGNMRQNAADLMTAGLQSFESGFGQMFSNMLTTAQTFGQAITGLFRSIAASIASEIGKLIGSAIFRAFLKLLGFFTHVPIMPMTDFSGGGVPVDVPIGVPGNRAGRAPGGAGMTININALDIRSGLMQLRSPGGMLRSAFDTMATQGSFS